MSLDTPVVIMLTTITTQILKAVGCVGSLYWRHNELDGVSNNERVDCMLNPLFRCRSKKTSKLHVFGLCEGNPLVTGGFPSQRASNTEKLLFDDIIMWPLIKYPVLCTKFLLWWLWICWSKNAVPREIFVQKGLVICYIFQNTHN